MHGFVLADYLPTFLNNSTLFIICTGREPSDEVIFNSFLNCIDERDQAILVCAMNKRTYDDGFKAELASFMCNYGVNIMLVPGNVKEMIISISKVEVLIHLTFYHLYMVSEKMMSIFKNLTSSSFFAFLLSFRSNGTKRRF